ncbi:MULTISPECIES: gephyrin-like molybdotransferase Glp [unclassified Achromobacter]|uniref:molybdopterin molybdotransferase MoeA n=1 Tax=unclassified Achromobacter TaxID=2626865 RepID=UPI000B5162F2|nr:MULTISPECIES: gephyrin-like molybdotransferase Glp [unclassified Achromobacter]OWT75372.1 molybdopterin molybdenumtransferase MoeA [Achromobacter sp. HZ28]OWT76032.1 molybdopterin molybdenumtransferase MoeA [Achromobacter sp. HZ34]
MLEFDDAQRQLAQGAPAPTRTLVVPLHEAAGLVLATDITATLDLPPADNSAMDGYALRYEDYAAAGAVPPALPVQQIVYAGQAPAPQAAGQLTRLFTGSIMPVGADTVIMQEDTRAAESADSAGAGRIEILAEPKPGQHVRRRGEDVAAGQPLLAAGTRLDAAHIALLASQGLAEVTVHPAVRVGILTTGDELVTPGTPRTGHQIYNSNGVMLAALVNGMGARATHVLHARDDEASLQAALQTLTDECDLVLSVGGVSVGDKDLVKPALESLGATLALWKVRMKPGKPVAMAHVAGKPVVCLPGNPVSAYAVFTVLVTPLLRRMQGRKELFPQVSYLTLRTPKPRHDAREEFLRVQRVVNAGSVGELAVFDRQSSGVMSSLPWATGLARIPAGVPVYDGEKVAYYDFRHWQA